MASMVSESVSWTDHCVWYVDILEKSTPPTPKGGIKASDGPVKQAMIYHIHVLVLISFWWFMFWIFMIWHHYFRVPSAVLCWPDHVCCTVLQLVISACQVSPNPNRTCGSATINSQITVMKTRQESFNSNLTLCSPLAHFDSHKW